VKGNKMAKSMKVQAFYNVNFNLGDYSGQSKFAWGFSVFDLSDETPLTEQILKQLDYHSDQVFNLNLTAFTPVGDVNFREGK
jgi:hypothetical protein